MRQPAARAENYTNAFLVTMWGIVFMALFTLAAAGGTLWVLLGGVAFERAVAWLGRRRARRAGD